MLSKIIVEGDFFEIFTNWLCTKFIQHLQKGAKKISYARKEMVDGYDQKRTHSYKGGKDGGEVGQKW